MALRIPRGYAVDRPYYQELSKGERFAPSEEPATVFTGLAHVRIDELHHDPVVLEPGTLVGYATGGVASGTLLPAVWVTGTNDEGGTGGRTDDVLYQLGSAEARTEWGLPNATSGNLTSGIVKPIGLVYQPIYSFILQDKFTNYKKNENVGVLTNYIIQIPVTNLEENQIKEGDLVALGTGQHHGAGWGSPWSQNLLAGRYAKYSGALSLNKNGGMERVVGRCLKRLHLGVTTEAAGSTLKTAITNGTFTLSAHASRAFKGLAKVQTVPGLSLGGSETKGVPGWLLGARSTGSEFNALTILIRL